MVEKTPHMCRFEDRCQENVPDICGKDASMCGMIRVLKKRTSAYQVASPLWAMYFTNPSMPLLSWSAFAPIEGLGSHTFDLALESTEDVCR